MKTIKERAYNATQAVMYNRARPIAQVVEEEMRELVKDCVNIVVGEIGSDEIANTFHRQGEAGRRMIEKLHALMGLEEGKPDTLDLDPTYLQMCMTSKHIPVAFVHFTIAGAPRFALRICERCGLVFTVVQKTDSQETEKDHE